MRNILKQGRKCTALFFLDTAFMQTEVTYHNHHRPELDPLEMRRSETTRRIDTCFTQLDLELRLIAKIHPHVG